MSILKLRLYIVSFFLGSWQAFKQKDTIRTNHTNVPIPSYLLQKSMIDTNVTVG